MASTRRQLRAGTRQSPIPPALQQIEIRTKIAKSGALENKGSRESKRPDFKGRVVNSFAPRSPRLLGLRGTPRCYREWFEKDVWRREGNWERTVWAGRSEGLRPVAENGFRSTIRRTSIRPAR